MISTLRDRLELGEDFPSLHSALAAKWKASPPTPSSEEGRRSRAGFDIEVGATADSGTQILSFLSSLVSRRSAGSDHIVLAVVSGAGGVDLVHSLFLVNESEYEETPPELWGIVGEIPAEGFPRFTQLTNTIFASNFSFVGTSSSEFESHVTSLNSIHPRDFDSNAHQPAATDDDGSRPISSRGAAFLPVAAALAILDLGDGASIAEVACRGYPVISNSDTTSFDTAADWLQASFTSRKDGSYISGPIRTRRELPTVNPHEGSFRHTIAVKHLQLSFPGHYLPPSPPSSPAKSNPMPPIESDKPPSTSATTTTTDSAVPPHPHVSWKSGTGPATQSIPGRGVLLRLRGGSTTSTTATS